MADRKNKDDRLVLISLDFFDFSSERNLTKLDRKQVLYVSRGDAGGLSREYVLRIPSVS